MPRRSWPGWLIAAIAIGAVVAVASTVGIIAISRYHQETKIDRSTPTLAVTQLVKAMFVERDPAAVARFSCRNAHLDPLQKLAHDLQDREQRFRTHFGVTVSGMQLTGTSTVTAELGLSAAGTHDVQSWIFETADENGWRVCSARPAH